MLSGMDSARSREIDSQLQAQFAGLHHKAGRLGVSREGRIVRSMVHNVNYDLKDILKVIKGQMERTGNVRLHERLFKLAMDAKLEASTQTKVHRIFNTVNNQALNHQVARLIDHTDQIARALYQKTNFIKDHQTFLKDFQNFQRAVHGLIVKHPSDNERIKDLHSQISKLKKEIKVTSLHADLSRLEQEAEILLKTSSRINSR